MSRPRRPFNRSSTNSLAVLPGEVLAAKVVTEDVAASRPEEPKKTTRHHKAKEAQTTGAGPSTQPIPLKTETFPTKATVHEICGNFSWGYCYWGERCHRIHVRPSKKLPDSPAAADTVTGSGPIVKLPCRSLQSAISDAHVITRDDYSSFISDLTGDANAPVVRLRPNCTSSTLTQDRISGRYDDLSWDEQTNFWGWKSDTTAWTSSDDGLTSSTMSSTSSKSSATPQKLPPRKPPPPPSRDVCRQWLRGVCSWGYNCRYIHEDLEYSQPDPPTPARRPPPHPPEPHWTFTVHDHTKVKLGSGFEIHEITTGVETPWLVLSNIPVRVTSHTISALLAPFGTVVDMKLPATPAKDFTTVRARFSSHAEALQASTALNGSVAFRSKTKIVARIPLNARTGTASLQDSSVRIEWEAPRRVAYGGYRTMAKAEEAIAATRTPCGDYIVSAAVHVGIPSIGVVTVKFLHLPPTANDELMQRFGPPDDIMWERPNYLQLPPAVDGVKRLLRDVGNPELDIQPPPYSSPSAAETAAQFIHGPNSRATSKIWPYNLTHEEYEKHDSFIQALRRGLFQAGYSSMGIALGWLKSEFEIILRGEILRQDGVPVWDAFFIYNEGASYLRSVIDNNPGIRIERDVVRRQLKLFGLPPRRARARTVLLGKMSELKAQRVRTIRMSGRVIDAFVDTQLLLLNKRFGADKISVDTWQRVLLLRGGDELYDAAMEAVHRVQQTQDKELVPRRDVVECPVCFNRVISPITLRCGHTWCRPCLGKYLLAAIDNRYFPLSCLGDEAKCSELIPLTAAREILQTSEFNAVVDASISSYVHAHAKQFHYCPSPDCTQIYRTGPKGTVVQCPACLLRICPHCHAEAHDGFPCAEQDGGDKLFKKWAASHDVKNCPGCAIPIERDEGCHHVTCIQCQTHICWVCLQTFPKGEGIYAHMRAEHGGIGLAQGAGLDIFL
ncbi:hypothetical protein C8J57DRAFT_1395122 [Mycena rebaudengoi]|nr:hypothetical protein C8J57DRAFT_1395122 [Mycena rebaudengoi]